MFLVLFILLLKLGDYWFRLHLYIFTWEYYLSTPFQNRLVGTVIVAAAVIIFLPNLLDGKKTSNRTDFDKIPPATAFTGEMTKKNFPEQKLIKKEKAAVLNEQPKDGLLKKQRTAQSSQKAQTDKVQSSTTKVTPATKVEKIVASTPSKKKTKSAITKPAIGQQPPKAINKEAWVIQLGSFKHKSNVAELVTKLKRNGYTVFTKPIKTKKGTLTKVFVGPELIKATLTKKISALKKLTNVQGKVARFYPIK